MKFALTFRQKWKENTASAYVSKREEAFIMMSKHDEKDALHFCTVLESSFFQLYKT